MTCKDCIHKRLCVVKAFPDMFENTKWDKERCDQFKNKADFVEVVRCKDCEHWKRIAFDNIFECDFGICHNPCDETEKETIERDYCSYGKRKEGRSDE